MICEFLRRYFKLSQCHCHMSISSSPAPSQPAGNPGPDVGPGRDTGSTSCCSHASDARCSGERRSLDPTKRFLHVLQPGAVPVLVNERSQSEKTHTIAFQLYNILEKANYEDNKKISDRAECGGRGERGEGSSGHFEAVKILCETVMEET